MVKTSLLATSLAGLLLAAGPASAMVELNGSPANPRHHDTGKQVGKQVGKRADKPGHHATARHDYRPDPWGYKPGGPANPPSHIVLPDLSPPPAVLPDALPLAGAVPEPASWLMLIAGFGFVGLSMRRRTKAKLSRPPLFYG